MPLEVHKKYSSDRIKLAVFESMVPGNREPVITVTWEKPPGSQAKGKFCKSVIDAINYFDELVEYDKSLAKIAKPKRVILKRRKRK